ncbi:hypothetical protein GRF29_77g391476 [Pseudopithomyces chartarum]|uniref:Prefoldin subunit 2 n=1 Tax=Pseudopithomyces chartarum TaxID=1892770 RepID=A0AAN6LVQ2_9PLEO|nr:hypothetical protein GRF29_77g391476 [Pseudopithomyces chartarum]
MLPLLPRLLPIQPRALQPLRPQAHIHLVLRIRAVPKHLVHEAPRVALVQRGDDIRAVCTKSLLAYLQQSYQNYKNTLQTIASKIGDIEQETEEHKLVLETLEPLPGDRKCFRMINGVLTERTVKEVVPILKTNSDGLKKALEELVKQYKTKQDEMEKWKLLGGPQLRTGGWGSGADGVT